MHLSRPQRLLLLVLATAGMALAQGQPPKGITRVASVEGITEYRLDNGLRALLFPDPSKATITVNITYLVGSRHENYGETGMAHLIEHLVSFGSPRHLDAKKEQTDRGASRNATTSFDRTNYFEIFPASDENLEWAIDLESDRMMGAPVRKEILATQMSVVRNEYEASENSSQGVLSKRIMAAAFEWHNYGKTTIGAKSDIENVPIERLQDFYTRYYRPDNAVLVVAGRFDENKTLNLLAKWFGPAEDSRDSRSSDLHRGTHSGWRALRSPPPRWRLSAGQHALQDPGRRAPDTPLLSMASTRSPVLPPADCISRWWNPKRRPPFWRPEHPARARVPSSSLRWSAKSLIGRKRAPR